MSKKYFFVMLAALVIQSVFGINFADAGPCDAEISNEWKKDNRIMDVAYPLKKYGDLIYLRFASQVNFASNGDGTYSDGGGKHSSCSAYVSRRLEYEDILNHCLYKKALETNCKNLDNLNFSETSNSSSNQPSSSSSSQSNKKANRQSAENQSSSSSNSSDQSKKKLNEAIDQFNSADKQNDYATALTALKTIIANTPDKEQKADATNKLGQYYKYGYGVQKDVMKAQALFEQASMDGSTGADAQICDNYLNGVGVTENHQTAIKYCTSAANSGRLTAMASLGWIYATGTGTQNTQLAKEWTCKAAKKGHEGSIKNAQKLNFNCN